MSLHPLLPRRNIAAWFGALCFFLMLAALLDGIIAGGRKDPLINEVVPGESIKLSGPMPRDAERLDQLWLRAADPAIGLALEEIRTGFWLGGQQWQASVTVPAQIGTGDHIVSLSARNETSPKMTQTYTLRVFASPKALKDASLSLTTSTFGISPFFLAIIALPLGVASGVASTLLSRRITQDLRARGMAQVFRIQRTPEGQRIFFCLGSENGLSEGDELDILDAQGATVIGSAAASVVRAADAESLLPEGQSAPINSFVRLRQ